MKLGFKCPCCDRKLAGVEMMQHATQVVRRSCRCKARWQIKVTPLGSRNGMSFHDGEFTRIEGEYDGE